MAKYGKRAQKTVESAMRRRKRGTLRSSSGDKVVDRDQAIAIGLSEARAKGAKVPKAPSRRAGARKTSARKTSATRSSRATGGSARKTAKTRTGRRKAAKS